MFFRNVAIWISNIERMNEKHGRNGKMAHTRMDTLSKLQTGFSSTESCKTCLLCEYKHYHLPVSET